MSAEVASRVTTPAATEALLRFRPELRIYDSQPGDSDTRYTVYDPVTDLSYFLGKRELMTARLFDGQRTLEDIAECLGREYRDVVPLEKLTAFKCRLVQYGLLEELGSGRRRRLRDPAMGISYGPLKSLLMIPVLRIDPNNFLNFLYRRCAWLCTPAFVLLGLVMIVMSAVLVGINYEAFRQDTVAVYGAGVNWLLWHYPVVVTSIFFHEVGHALTCRAYRVRVTDFGIAVYLLLATGWARPLQRDWNGLQRSQRLMAIFMGPYASLLYASMGILLWYSAPPFTAFNTLGIVMAVSATLALVPTLLPMFNGDTYLAMTELIGVSRLRQRAFRYVKALRRGDQPEECLTRRRKLLYWGTVAGTVLGWLAAWLMLAHVALLVWPLV